MSKKHFNILFLVIVLALTMTLAGCDELEKFSAGALDQAGHMVPEEYQDIAVPFEPHLNYITTQELLELYTTATSTERVTYEEYATDWDFVLVDSRPAARYHEGHINGAINIPDADFDKLKDLLPEDKDKKLIFYCGGWHCPLSPSSANKAMNLGYTNVYVYQEGTDHGWNLADTYLVITPEFFKGILTEEYMMDPEQPPLLIIDSRPFASYFKENIPMSIPADNPEPWNSRFSGLAPANKDTLIITYCGGFF
ncbi:rhodanese-like domain-containing protein [Desulfuribacillus alkaliarsenatis]|nr:rhodanese-like domain-containing protein [Desulfuribacillus alkaliarsenatis]